MENNKESMQVVDLKYFRIINNILQKDLASFLGVTTSFISRVENGQCKLPAEHLARLLDNEMGWRADALYPAPGQRTEINSGMKNVGNISGNAINSTVNNYQGYSEEDFRKELEKAMAEKNHKLEKVMADNESLLMQVSYLKSQIAWQQGVINQLIGQKDAPEMRQSEEN